MDAKRIEELKGLEIVDGIRGPTKPELRELLDAYELLKGDIRDFMDDRADAETLPDRGDVGNREMRLLGEIDAIGK